MKNNFKDLTVYEKRKKYIKELNEGVKYTNIGEIKLNRDGTPKFLSKEDICYRRSYIKGVDDTLYVFTGNRSDQTFEEYKYLLKKQYNETIKYFLSKGNDYNLAKKTADTIFAFDIQAVKEGRFCDPNLTSIKNYSKIFQ